MLSNNSTTLIDIEATLAKLVEYTKFHFQEEESLMNSNGLDSRHIQEHKKLHNQVTQEILVMRTDFLSGRLSVKTDILNFPLR